MAQPSKILALLGLRFYLYIGIHYNLVVIRTIVGKLLFKFVGLGHFSIFLMVLDLVFSVKRLLLRGSVGGAHGHLVL